MQPIRRKLLEGFGTLSPSPNPRHKPSPTPPKTPAANTPNLAEEYLAWARWLDVMHERARQGSEQEVRDLADGKLRFVLRRCMVLREKTMLGGTPGHVLLDETALLARELEQTIGELTGREMPPVDQWPLPCRLYHQQPASSLSQPPLGYSERRRERPARQNQLTDAEHRDAQQAVGCLVMVLQLLRRQPVLIESLPWHAAHASLSRIRDMGRLHVDPGALPAAG
ncbi:hypothetical protein [Vogesella sp. LIG4]|uniref:hypothetical protein n=1 Tax=Vogesella sp. LIG4 TaxID=1192162 RepID=UPI00081FFDB1|nr:hypothetical protein [Vogesella sp. LIG4]SCK25501.1 hypothetical protein PSELUDRAFT_3035 [Vogesella sp. LIG4]